VMEPATIGFALEPAAVHPHLACSLDVAERPVGTKHAKDGRKSNTAPLRVGDVNRENEPAARPEQPKGLGQYAIVGVCGPGVLGRRVRLGILNRHSGDGPVELAALPRSQAGAEIASHKANLLWRRGGLHSRSQPPKSALIGGGTIQPDDFLDL